MRASIPNSQFSIPHFPMTNLPVKPTLWHALRQNPVTLKELRSRMRGRRAFVVLTVYLLFMSLFLALIYLAYLSTTGPGGSGARDAGKIMFTAVLGMQISSSSSSPPPSPPAPSAAKKNAKPTTSSAPPCFPPRPSSSANSSPPSATSSSSSSPPSPCKASPSSSAASPSRSYLFPRPSSSLPPSPSPSTASTAPPA